MSHIKDTKAFLLNEENKILLERQIIIRRNVLNNSALFSVLGNAILLNIIKSIKFDQQNRYLNIQVNITKTFYQHFILLKY